MKIRRKIIVYSIIIIFIIAVINICISKSRTKVIRGNIVIWTSDKYFSYFNSIAKDFEENNKRVKVEIVNVKEEDYLNKIMNTDKKDLPNIVHLNFMELEKMKDQIKFINENKKIIETYNKNFNESRLQEVRIDDNYYAVPFTSNPIALFLRVDILNDFGYNMEDINTWEQLLSMGEDIYNRSNGEIKIFSSEDRENINILLAAQLADYEGEIYSNKGIIDNINLIYKDELISESVEDCICRIASIDFNKEVNNGNVGGAWECKNPPSFKVGENRFYDIGGENLVALKVDNEEEAIKSFISYAATHKELLSKELLNSNFVPSSLYSLKIKDENKSVDNIVGNSPFLILSNIVERAPKIKNYELFKDVIYDIYN